MNIGIFTELFPPSVGGQEQRFAALADLLAVRGHRVTVVCVHYPIDAAAEEILPTGVRVIRGPALPRYYKPLGGLLPRSPVGMLRFALAARRVARINGFDAVFMNQWPLLHVLAVGRNVRQHALLDWCEIRHGLLLRTAQFLLPKLVAANTAVSTQVAEKIGRTAQGRVLVLPSGIEVAAYQEKPAECRHGLLYVGRVARHKNLALLIDTFEELCRRGYSERLTIAGSGPDLEAVRRRAAASSFGSAIDVPGFISDERKIDLLASARLLVLTSQREGFPRVVAEAMASGLPVITARYPQNGTVDVVGEFGCGLCAAPTACSLADAAQSVLADWPAWSARSRLHAETLDWSVLIRRLEALLQYAEAGTSRAKFAQQPEGLSCELQ